MSVRIVAAAALLFLGLGLVAASGVAAINQARQQARHDELTGCPGDCPAPPDPVPPLAILATIMAAATGVGLCVAGVRVARGPPARHVPRAAGR